MGLYDIAKDALKEIPMSEIMRARLELAVDQASALEREVADLQTEIGRLQAQLERLSEENNEKDRKLKAFYEASKEEVVLYRTLEFRKGAYTRGRWEACCPKCHLPVRAREGGYYLTCSDQQCQYMSQVTLEELPQVMRDFEKGERG